MPHGPTRFRSTVIKPYYRDDSSDPVQEAPASEDALEKNHDQGDHDPDTITVDMPQPRHKELRNSRNLVDFEEQFVAAIEGGVELSMAFITAKEKADLELAKQLRKEGRITTPGAPF
jgi:hypothetical protein